MTSRSRWLSSAAALLAAGALALTGCGGGDSAGSTPATSAATSAAPAGPALAASQEIVDLFNSASDRLPDAEDDLPLDDPPAMAKLAEDLRGFQRELTAKLDEVEAAPCVEQMARRRLPLMALVANLAQAVADGRLTDAIGLGQQLQDIDPDAHKAEEAACKARVGYKGLDDR